MTTLPGSGASIVVNEDGSFIIPPGDAFDSLGAGDSATETVFLTESGGSDEAGNADAIELVFRVDGVTDMPLPSSLRPIVVTTTFELDSESSGLRANALVALIDPEGDLLTVVAINGDGSLVGEAFELPSGAARAAV
jgi:hypothetical protein